MFIEIYSYPELSVWINEVVIPALLLYVILYLLFALIKTYKLKKAVEESVDAWSDFIKKISNGSSIDDIRKSAEICIEKDQKLLALGMKCADSRIEQQRIFLTIYK